MDYASDVLCGDPRIDDCELTHNSLEVTKRELVETRLYCPLTFRVDPDDPCDDYDEVDSANYIGSDMLNSLSFAFCFSHLSMQQSMWIFRSSSIRLERDHGKI